MKRPNTTTVLLAVVAVLLGLNLWHSTAKAQPQVPPRVIQIEASGGSVTQHYVYRLWSDGLVERQYWCGSASCCDDGWCGWLTVPG